MESEFGNKKACGVESALLLSQPQQEIFLLDAEVFNPITER